MMRICSVIDLGLSPFTRRFSRSTTRSSSFWMVSFRPETTSSVMGAIVNERLGGGLRGERRGMDEERAGWKGKKDG